MENKNTDTEIDRLIKLAQAEKKMKEVMKPIPSRPTLINYIKKGILIGKRIGNNFYLYESSMNRFIEESKKKT